MNQLKDLLLFALYGIVAGVLALMAGSAIQARYGTAWSLMLPLLLAAALFGMWPLVRRSTRHAGRLVPFWRWAAAVIAVCGLLLVGNYLFK